MLSSVAVAVQRLETTLQRFAADDRAGSAAEAQTQQWHNSFDDLAKPMKHQSCSNGDDRAKPLSSCLKCQHSSGHSALAQLVRLAARTLQLRQPSAITAALPGMLQQVKPQWLQPCKPFRLLRQLRHWRRSLGSLKCPSRSLHHLLPGRGAPRLWLQTRQSESPSPVEHAARTLRPARPSATIAAASKAERLPMCLRTETFHADRVVKD